MYTEVANERNANLWFCLSMVTSWQQPGGIENEGELRCDVNESCEQRIEQAKSSKCHADAVHGQGSGKVLHDNAMAPP